MRHEPNPYRIAKIYFREQRPLIGYIGPPGGSEWIISVGDYVDNSFTALGISDPREVRLEL